MLRALQQMKGNESRDAIEMAVAGQPDLLDQTIFLAATHFGPDG